MQLYTCRRRSGSILTGAPAKEIQTAAGIAQWLKAALDKTVETRQHLGKTRPPAPIYTVEEAKSLGHYSQTRELPVDDIRKAARLVAQQKLARADLVETQRKAEAFETRRHLWRFQIEGWDTKLSLKDIETAIRTKHEEKLKLLNFIRPGKRALIQGHIHYLSEVKADIQKQLAAQAEAIRHRLERAKLRESVTQGEVARISQERADKGEQMPRALYTTPELTRMASVADRNFDGSLLREVHEVAKRNLPTDRESAALMVGRALVAGLRMAKAEEAERTARQFYRHNLVPVPDQHGRDQAVSVREVEPRTLAEAITNRLIRPADQRPTAQDVRNQAEARLHQAQAEAKRALDYYNARWEIANDYCRAAGVRYDNIAPTLTAEQIQEIKEYLPRMRDDDFQKSEFKKALPLAERALSEREDQQKASRDREPGRAQPERQVSLSDQRTQEKPEPSRDRDTSFRGR